MGGNRRGELTSRQWLAYQLQMSGRYPEALENLGTCLKILDEIDSRFIKNWVLLGMANIHRILGDPAVAIELYTRAAALFEDVGNTVMTTMCLTEMGSCHAMMGDYRRALRIYAQAAALDGGEDRRGMGSYIMNFEGDCYFQLGNYNEALDHYQRATELAEERGDRSVLYAPLGGLAAVYAAVGEPERAVNAYRRALDVARTHHDNEYEIRAWIGLAEQVLALGRRGEARHSLAEAESLLPDAGQYGFRCRILMLKSRCTDDHRDAIILLEDALSMAVQGGLPEHEWNCLTEIGDRCLALGDTAVAVDHQRRAIRVIESLRRRVGMDDLQRNLMEPAILPYERLIDILVEDDPAAAFSILERSRARILAERLERSLAGAVRDLEPVRSREERELRAALSFAMSRLQDPETDADVREAVRREIQDLEARAMLLDEGGFPGWMATSDDDGLVVNPIAAIESGERMLSYFLGSRRSFLFSVSGESGPTSCRHVT